MQITDGALRLFRYALTSTSWALTDAATVLGSHLDCIPFSRHATMPRGLLSR